ncbi:hypothetical protein AB0P21_32700 [Kribbella sp. NPDC056861]
MVPAGLGTAYFVDSYCVSGCRAARDLLNVFGEWWERRTPARVTG